MAEIAQLVDKEIIKHRRHLNVPKVLLKPAAKILNKALWWPTMSADEVEREFIDQKIDPTAKTFADLGLEPADLSGLTFYYLVSSSLPSHSPVRSCYQDTSLFGCWVLIRIWEYSKDTGARPSSTCHPPRRGRRGRRGSICMWWTISD